MRKTRKMWLAASAAVVLVVAAVAGVAVTGAVGGDDDQPITGAALDRASAAALAYTGDGRITETETGDEESLYEVEVTLDDGRQVDVQLDADFNVVGDKVDHEDTDTDDTTD